MGIYVSHVGLPQVIGRKKWFPDAKLARIIVGFHLRDVDMDKQPLWDSVHKEWLRLCREDFARWTSVLSS